MAKGFRRQGEWQVGFQQRSMPSDVKRKLQRNKLMEQQAKEEINKRPKYNRFRKRAFR